MLVIKPTRQFWKWAGRWLYRILEEWHVVNGEGANLRDEIPLIESYETERKEKIAGCYWCYCNVDFWTFHKAVTASRVFDSSVKLSLSELWRSLMPRLGSQAFFSHVHFPSSFHIVWDRIVLTTTINLPKHNHLFWYTSFCYLTNNQQHANSCIKSLSICKGNAACSFQLWILCDKSCGCQPYFVAHDQHLTRTTNPTSSP